MAECPPEEHLAAFAAGAPDGDRADAIAEHLEQCSDCRRWLDRERQAAGWFRDVRAIASTSALRDEAAVTPGASRLVASAADPQRAGSGPPPMPIVPGCDVERVISHGGQGIVYEAFQHTTKRRVAVKVLLPGAHLSASSRKRFEREVELVAQLRHPGVISVFGSGSLEDSGAQYYVMEYIDGLPLQRHVRDRKLGLEGTLELFAAVCDAVQHAHQNGVVHRDLKPSNILVDQEGHPKILDFGLAKPVTGGEATPVSLSREVLGTVPYMSPEQAAGDSATLDTRTDIYALGVVLYELLTGDYPYPVRGPLPEALRHISETPPTPPTRCWTPDSGIARHSARRSRGQRCPIDDDVQTILLKALAKERDRRYQSAGNLAADIRHYLAGEPIEARRDSGWYVLRKSLRRYRVATALTAAFLVVVISALAAVFQAWRKAERDASRAEQSLAFAKLTHQLLPADEADMVGHIQNIRQLTAFRQQSNTSLISPDVSHGLRRDRVGLLAKLELALSRNNLALPARLLVSDVGEPTLVQIFRDLDHVEHGNALLDRLSRRLECWIRVPPPLGRSQEMLDCIEALALLDSENERASEARAAWTRLADRLPVIYAEDFSAFQLNDVPPGWQAKEGVEILEVRPPGKELLISSNASTSGTAIYQLYSDAPVLTFTCSMRVVVDDPAHLATGSSAAQLCGRDGKICGVGLFDGRFVAKLPDQAPVPSVARPRPVKDQTFCVELRYFRSRGTFDALRDGRYLVEEAPCMSGGSVTEFQLGASHRLRVYVDNLIVRAGNAEFKRDLGDHVPLVTCRRLPIEFAGVLPMRGNKILSRDFDADGRSELVVGDAVTPGSIRFYRVCGRDYECTELRALNLGSDFHLEPQCLIGQHIAVSGFGRDVSSTQQRSRGFRLLDIAENFNAQAVFSEEYDDQGFVRVAPMRLAPDRSGFVVFMGDENRFLDVFEASTADAAKPYRRVGRYRPERPGYPGASDILSAVAYDWSGDGGEDLFVGWGPWTGNGPAMLRFADGLPVDTGRTSITVPSAVDSESEPSAAASVLARRHPSTGGPASTVLAHPLTGQVGRTRVALGRSDIGLDYLIAASARADTESGYQTTGEGVRVWPISGGLLKHEPVPIYYEPGDAAAVAAGQFGSREVFATMTGLPVVGEPTLDRTVTVCGISGDRIDKLWEATFFNTPWTADPRLHFIDINQDGVGEIVVTLQQHEALVFRWTGH